MSKELKDNWLKWTVLLGAIVVAAVISSKAITSVATPVTTSHFTILDTTNKGSVPNNGNQPRIIADSLLKVTAGSEDTLFLYGEVADENSEFISQGIIKLNETTVKTPILLIIDSPGGAVFPGSKIISAIEASKRPVYTICYGTCASMAAMIHQYGTKRLMVNRSVLMFHNASGGAQGEVNQMLSQLHFVDSFCAKMDSFVATRAGISFTEFANLCNSQIWIDSEDSLKRGFSDQTVSVNLSNLKKEVLLPFTNHLKQHKRLQLEYLKNDNR